MAYVLAATLCLGLGTLLYFCYAPFRYKARMTFFYLYMLFVSVVCLPYMAVKGRCEENLATLSWAMNPARWLLQITSEIREGKNMIKDKPCVIVSNHQSSLDVLGMAEMYPPKASFLAKRELLYTGSVGLVLWLCGGIFIDRSKHKTANEVLQKICEEVIDRRIKLWIFPEGTRNPGGGMLSFKKGAFNIAVKAKIPVVPVVFKSYEDFYCKKKYVFKPGKYIAEVLPPVSTEGLTMDDVPELSEKVRKQMLAVYQRLSSIS